MYAIYERLTSCCSVRQCNIDMKIENNGINASPTDNLLSNIRSKLFQIFFNCAITGKCFHLVWQLFIIR